MLYLKVEQFQERTKPRRNSTTNSRVTDGEALQQTSSKMNSEMNRKWEANEQQNELQMSIWTTIERQTSSSKLKQEERRRKANIYTLTHLNVVTEEVELKSRRAPMEAAVQAGSRGGAAAREEKQRAATSWRGRSITSSTRGEQPEK